MGLLHSDRFYYLNLIMATLGLFIAVVHLVLISGFSDARLVDGTRALIVLLYVGALSLMWHWWGSAAYKSAVIV